MRMRGVEKQNSFVVTSAMLGGFRSNHGDARRVHEPDRQAVNAAEAALALLGPLDGPVVVAEPGAWWAARVRVAGLRTADLVEPTAAAALVSFVGARTPPALRRPHARRVARAAPVGAPLVLVDHNQPRQWWRRPLACCCCAVARLAPSGRGIPRRASSTHPAFGSSNCGWRDGERVQVVLARRED
jgi:hypothetical protein